jgi:L-fuculose-phosphate aldolase
MSYYRNPDREHALREQIVRIGRLMYDRGLIVANDGNISARLDEGRILCTPSGVSKGMLTPEQLLIVDMEGRRVGLTTSANRTLSPTSETAMHLEAYRQRPDVGGVVHAHPPITVALSIAGISLADCMLPEVIVNLGLVPTTDYATPASRENVDAIRNLVGTHDGIILQRHGALTVGRDPWQAFMRMEFMEQAAQVTLILQQLGKGEPLPPDQVQKLLAQRQKMGLAHEGEEEEMARAWGLPGESAGQPTAPSDAQPGSVGQDAELVALITRAVMRELARK